MLAEISVFPLDKGGEGLSRYVAEAVRAIESSGLDFEVHALGTLIGGRPTRSLRSFDNAMSLWRPTVTAS